MSKLIPRPYQLEAYRAIINELRTGGTPYVNMSTGSGKNLTAAMIADKVLQQGGRALMLVPSKELVSQNYATLFDYTDFKRDIGICCAKLDKYQINKQCVIATYTSFLSRRAKAGKFNVLILDECFSGDTLISTPSGLKKIKEVSNNDIVYNAVGTGIVQAVSVKNHDTIYKVRLTNGKEIKTTNNHPIFTQYGWVRAENLGKRHIVIGLQDLRKLRKNNDTNKTKRKCNTKRPIFKNELLLNKLFETERKRNVDGWRKRKNERDIKANWTQTSNTWRQWQRINRATKTNGRNTRHWVENGIAYKNECGSSEWCLSELLQSRHWQQGFKNSNRIGRGIAQWKKKIVRRKKRQFSKIVRVESVTVEKSGGVTPMYNLQVSGHPSYFAGGVLVHNCHYLSAKYDSSYQKIIRSLRRINPALKICGLSATPFRTGQGELHNNCVDGAATFTKCVYTTDIAQLIHDGYLSRIESISGDIQADLSGVKTKAGDYDQEMAAVKFEAILPNAIPDIKLKIELYGIKTALIFASNVANARAIIELWGDDTARLVYGDMTSVERVKTIEWLKNGKGLRVIVNVNVLLVGFDFRKLDAVVFLRATKSLALYMQAVGRALRSHDEKECGYVLDYAGNVDRHGSIDGVIPPKTIKKSGDAPTKLCLNCDTVNPASAKECRECGSEFVPDPNAAGLYSMRSAAEILRSKWTTHDVDYVMYESVLSKKGDPMLRIDYYDGFGKKIISKFLLLENGGTGGTIAQHFLLKMFKNTRDFYALNASGGLNCTDVALMLTSAYDEYFKRVVSVTVGEQKDSSKYKELKSIVYESN